MFSFCVFFFPFLFLFAVLCRLFFGVLEVHTYMCLNRLDTSKSCTAKHSRNVNSYLYIFDFVLFFLLGFLLFKFLIPHSLFSTLFFFHFYLFLHWRYTTKVMVTLSVLSNCFTLVFPIAVLSVTFWLFSALMAGNTVEQYRARLDYFMELCVLLNFRSSVFIFSTYYRNSYNILQTVVCFW